MARFRAYSSDSSSDEEVAPEPRKSTQQHAPVDEDLSDEEASSSSSSSDMDEDELQPLPNAVQPPGTIAEIVEEDEDEEDDEMLYERSPPRQKQTRGPALVDAQRMHVMQTSLFRVPEETAALQSRNQPRHTSIKIAAKALNRKHSRDSDGDGFRAGPKERASFAFDVEPPSHRPTRKYARVESSTSSFTGYEAASVDAGLSLGRSFRVGWGPGGTLVHLGAIVASSSSSKTPANSSTLSLSRAPAFASYNTALSTKLLQHHLSHSSIQCDQDGIPFANPSPKDLCFSSFAALFPPTETSYEASLFRLGQALFDDIDLHLAPSISYDIRSRVASLARREALSTWLEQTLAPTVDAEIKSNTESHPIANVFSYLTGNQTEKAVEAAIGAGYFKLSTLIAQAGGSFEFKEDLLEQLEIWREERVDIHVDENIRKVYALLAGIISDPLVTSKGAGPDRAKDLDVLAGLDWKRVFGLHLWYSQPLNSSINQVFEAFSSLTKISGQGRTVAQPLPWYAERLSSAPLPPSPSAWKLPPPSEFASDSLVPDGLYSLIRLHADATCSLSHIFNPLSFSPSPIDYSVPWHLYIILSRCMRVRDFSDRGHVGRRLEGYSEEEEWEGHSPSADLLASSYAYQLEQAGMVQEALFVLLHIEGATGREKAVKDLLCRSATRLDAWMIRGVVGSLKIPMAWIYEAQAILATRSNQMYEAYELYISARLFNQAHDIAVSDLAPDAIIREDLELLQNLFSPVAKHDVEGWHTRGKVFVDYANIVTRLPLLIAEQDPSVVPDAVQAQDIEELSRGIPRVIELIPDVLPNRSDVRHKIAVHEMVSRLIKLADKIRPLSLSHVQLSLVDEVSKLHIQSKAVASFLSSINSL